MLRGYLTTEVIIIYLENVIYGEHRISDLSDNVFFHKSINFKAIVDLFQLCKKGTIFLYENIPVRNIPLYSI